MVNNPLVHREDICPVCATRNISVFIEISQVPVHCNLLWPTRAEALSAPRGDIRLGFCGECGLVFNLEANPRNMQYTQCYENSLHCSPRFQTYAVSLARKLIERYGIVRKNIIEIGCGKGDFLRLICKLGDNRGVGFDESYTKIAVNETERERLTFIEDSYSEHYSQYPADLICCRHVLEHIDQPMDFLAMLRRTIGNRTNTVVYFEVPNALFMLRDLGLWDIIYEHFSYFSSSSLVYAFTSSGFRICELEETLEGQFLGIEAAPLESVRRPSIPDRGETASEIADAVTEFAERYGQRLMASKHTLDRFDRFGKRAVVWGAGSKGVTFLNMLKGHACLEYIVDINPRKQGMYIAGTGQTIVPPDFVRNYKPDVIILLNKIYEEEIRQYVKDGGLHVEFMFP